MEMPLVLLNRRRRGGFSPFALFSLGEQGAWFEAPRIATLTQDNAGATPVTAFAQTVGRAVDLSGNGLNATQATAGARPTYSVVPAGGRRNLLTYTEQVDNAAWSKGGVTISVNAGVAPDGTTTADALTEDTSSGPHRVWQTVVIPAANHALSFYAKPSGRDWVYVYVNGGVETAFINISTGETGTVFGSPTLSATAVGNGWYRISLGFPNTVTTSQNLQIWAASGNNVENYLGDGASGILLWGAQLETGLTATPYQKVVTAREVTESGAKSVAYFFDDGGDSLNWTATATNYTVARVNSAGAVTIQAAQALSGATDMLLDAQTVGYIAVNRALTTPETASLTAYLTRLAT